MTRCGVCVSAVLAALMVCGAANGDPPKAGVCAFANLPAVGNLGASPSRCPGRRRRGVLTPGRETLQRSLALLPRVVIPLRSSPQESGGQSEENDVAEGEIVIIGGQRFKQEGGTFINLDVSKDEVARNVHFEKEAIKAERSGDSPDRRDEMEMEVEDGRFGDDDFDADVEEGAAHFNVGGDGGEAYGGVTPSVEFGAWASEEYIDAVGPETVLGGHPLESMDDSVIKDYEEAIELGTATGGPEGSAAVPMGFEKEEIEELEARLSSALSGGGEEAAKAHHGLGAAMAKRGRLSEALEHIKQAVTIRVGLHSKIHSSVAEALNDVGIVYEKMSEFSLALNFYQEAVEIMERTRGDKITISSIQANMGCCFLHLGEVQKALTYFLNAYQMQKSLGDNHPSVAAITRNIGCAYLSRGDPKKALAYLDKALAAEVSIGGPMSLEAAESGSNSGLALLELGRYDEALERFEQVLDVRLNVLGERHPHVALTVKNLGHVHNQMGEPERALKYYEKALKMETDFYGEDSMHVHLAVTRCHIAQILSDIGDQDGARKLFERAAATFALRFGSSHDYTKIALEGAERSVMGDMRRALNMGGSNGTFSPGELLF